MTASQNPLLSFQFEVPFDRITAAHVEPAVDILLTRAKEALARVSHLSGPRTYANTLGALDSATEELEHAMAIVSHLENTENTPALREAHNAVQPKVSEFYANIPLDAALYRALKDFAVTAEARDLDPARARFLKTTLEDFARQGAELSPSGKKRLADLSMELSKATTQYSQNVLDSGNAFELVFTDKTRLSGLPASALDAAAESAADKGHTGAYRFTLQQPSYMAVMSYADDAALRKQIYLAYNSRATSAPHDNKVLVREIVALRREKAKLLGFKDFADLTLEDRMAKTGARAKAFIDDLRVATQAHFERENRELIEFRRELEGSDAPDLEPWDIGYYSEKMRKARYDFDEEELRPYFAIDAVLSGMFTLAERIYGIRVEADKAVPVYHESVRYYRVRAENGPEIGAFYADLHPRESKRGGAWMADFITGMTGGKHTRHLGVICANANGPVGGKPALLTHNDVQTLFHEFGHLLHHLLGRAQVRSLAGTRVAWDFVELPSMIMENFCWERPVLDLFARHYQSQEPIPEMLLKKLQRTRTFRTANMQMRQLGFAALDLGLHVDYDPNVDGDAITYARQIMQEYAPARLPSDYAVVAGFGHLFASPVGYAAGYYSYKWAEVLEADAFSRFAKEGVFSRDVGLEFARLILSRGNEADPMELYQSFMGRGPTPDALMKRAGLTA